MDTSQAQILHAAASYAALHTFGGKGAKAVGQVRGVILKGDLHGSARHVTTVGAAVPNRQTGSMQRSGACQCLLVQSWYSSCISIATRCRTCSVQATFVQNSPQTCPQLTSFSTTSSSMLSSKSRIAWEFTLLNSVSSYGAKSQHHNSEFIACSCKMLQGN